MATKKLNITIRTDLLERTDQYCDDNNISRSGLIALALTQYLNAVEAMPSVNKLLSSLAAVAEGTITGAMTKEESEAQLARIQSAYELMQAKAPKLPR